MFGIVHSVFSSTAPGFLFISSALSWAYLQAAAPFGGVPTLVWLIHGLQSPQRHTTSSGMEHLLLRVSPAMSPTMSPSLCLFLVFLTCPHVFSCVFCPQLLPPFVKYVCAEVSCVPLVEVLVCGGLFSSVTELAVTSCDQHRTVHGMHRSALKPPATKTPQFILNILYTANTSRDSLSPAVAER